MSDPTLIRDILLAVFIFVLYMVLLFGSLYAVQLYFVIGAKP